MHRCREHDKSTGRGQRALISTPGLHPGVGAAGATESGQWCWAPLLGSVPPRCARMTHVDSKSRLGSGNSCRTLPYVLGEYGEVGREDAGRPPVVVRLRRATGKGSERAYLVTKVRAGQGHRRYDLDCGEVL